jgi:hypothetical protein
VFRERYEPKIAEQNWSGLPIFLSVNGFVHILENGEKHNTPGIKNNLHV